MTTTTDNLDVRSTWQRTLDRDGTIRRKLDRLRKSRIDPATGHRETWQHQHWHLNAAQTQAVRLGARRAYYRYGRTHLPEVWQHDGGGYGRQGTANVEAAALEYANNHLPEIWKCWAEGLKDGGTNRAAHHVAVHMKSRMVRAIAADLKPHKDTHGHQTVVMPWGVWQDLEAHVLHDMGKDDRPRPVRARLREIRPLEQYSEADIERAQRDRKPRTWGARAARKVPREVREQLIDAFYPGPTSSALEVQRAARVSTVEAPTGAGKAYTAPAGRSSQSGRPSSRLNPSDDTGETVAHDMWHADVVEALETGMLPRHGDSERKMLTYQGKALENGVLPNGITLSEIAGMTIRSNE